MSIGGWQTLKEVQWYTKGVRRGRLEDVSDEGHGCPTLRNRPFKAALFVPVVICHDDLN